MSIAMAKSVDIDKIGTIRVWFPPTGKPYWVIAGKYNAGRDLTEEELKLVKTKEGRKQLLKQRSWLNPRGK